MGLPSIAATLGRVILSTYLFLCFNRGKSGSNTLCFVHLFQIEELMNEEHQFFTIASLHKFTLSVFPRGHLIYFWLIWFCLSSLDINHKMKASNKWPLNTPLLTFCSTIYSLLASLLKPRDGQRLHCLTLWQVNEWEQSSVIRSWFYKTDERDLYCIESMKFRHNSTLSWAFLAVLEPSPLLLVCFLQVGPLTINCS